jgi:hypothetical protein
MFLNASADFCCAGANGALTPIATASAAAKTNFLDILSIFLTLPSLPFIGEVV